MSNFNMGSEDPIVFIITGNVRRDEDTAMNPFNALLMAADDDSAVRQCLDALSREGFEEAELDQIGNILERPQDEEFQEAYDAALKGETALLLFHNDDDPASA
jgi:hypothetical protein